ncbi:sterol desaturase family protein [Brevundimonas sp.]|uniref:sterol desaturase family protein n=1 Tax=Brevundimonas sp. TaxID=1871086 RepID=UPI001A1945B2|nr:sterol desaturase family protein [Brevundimonas sp.]MBJ7484289.1 sterol desaturase family protein [Brevundimonas sp.]
MLVAVLITTAWLSLIIGARYLLVAGGVWWLLWGRANDLGRRLNRDRPSRRLMLHEVRYSLLSTPIYALPAAIALEAWKVGGTKLYLDPGAYPLWWLPLSFVLLLIVQDTHYYWTHRLLHHRSLFPWAHAAHHRARDPSPFASFAFDPAEAVLTAWLLPVLAFVVPLNIWMLAVLLTVMTASAVMNHCGWELWPDRWVRSGPGSQFITATHHSRHHTHMKTNFGLFFRLWDRLCATDAMPPERDQPGLK